MAIALALAVRAFRQRKALPILASVTLLPAVAGLGAYLPWSMLEERHSPILATLSAEEWQCARGRTEQRTSFAAHTTSTRAHFVCDVYERRRPAGGK